MSGYEETLVEAYEALRRAMSLVGHATSEASVEGRREDAEQAVKAYRLVCEAEDIVRILSKDARWGAQ